jgi:hypothetical protein
MDQMWMNQHSTCRVSIIEPDNNDPIHGDDDVTPVAYTAILGARCSRAPLPSSECTDATLALRSLVILVVVYSYIGSPWMGSMTEWGKLLMGDLTVVAAIVVYVAVLEPWRHEHSGKPCSTELILVWWYWSKQYKR